ncbi:hypothetical protein QO010_003375 [Caulobacter ginsengisoli]|uniref:Bacterial mobilisation domain-containing protein n=1 Tax=Caulobacter ginsengisoli TaxID=400775 RepID=A0ABU0IW59_9CAUL|nr:plasmid mobilization relaxosome protein MobC [Caulobacter ginsengisoli]MDQ0465586.1 hypothetical protein [Caulobacter ginsengisoli]
MRDAAKHRTHVTIRVSPEQRAQLERLAAGMPLGPFMLWRSLDPDSPPPRSRDKFPVKDHIAISQVLARLGDSRIANNINQLTRLAHTGSLPVSPETEDALRLVCRYLVEMRRLLLRALGLSDVPP